MLSPYSETLVRKRFSPQRKLLPHLYDKEKYVTHYQNLRFYLAAGMKLKKIHRIMCFNQSALIKPYIDFNTQKRREATSVFLQTLFKCLNNSVFGKMMDNMRDRMDLNLTVNPSFAKKLITRPSLKKFDIVNEDLTAIELQKTKVLMNKPTLYQRLYFETFYLHSQMLREVPKLLQNYSRFQSV